MAHVFADAALARRLEDLAAAECEAFGESAARLFPGSGAGSAPIADGRVGFTVPGMPFNQAFAVGMRGAVDDAEIDSLEAFFRERGESKAIVNVTPFTDRGFLAALAERGYEISGFDNVLVRELTGEPIRRETSHDIREAVDRQAWGLQVSRGFAAPEEPTQQQIDEGRIAAGRDGVVMLTAFVDGEPAGTGEVVITGDVGWLSADTTLPAFRGRGIQQAMHVERLARAQEAGCTLAMTEATPGSGSQRNMERAGFRIAYVRIEMSRPLG